MTLPERHELQALVHDNKLLMMKCAYYRALLDEMRTILEEIRQQDAARGTTKH